MSDGPAYLRTLESQLNLSNIGFGTMFTNASATGASGASLPAPTAPGPIIVSDIPQKKLKFMLVSTHLHQFTGYSKVAHNLVNELVKNPWLSLTHFGFQKHPQTPPDFRAYPAGVDVIDAAALEKPSCTILGGREPVQWNAYPRAHLFHMVGALKCCQDARDGKGCWRSRVVTACPALTTAQRICLLIYVCVRVCC